MIEIAEPHQKAPLFHRPEPAFGLTEAEACRSMWGMNCGPGALAGVLGIKPQDTLALLPDFSHKHYTTEIMMEAGLQKAGVPFTTGRGIFPRYGLVRVLWHGPWWHDPEPYARERRSHWIGIWRGQGSTAEPEEVFDINAIRLGGWRPFSEWTDVLVPWLLSGVLPEATCGYDIAESYEIDLEALSASGQT